MLPRKGRNGKILQDIKKRSMITRPRWLTSFRWSRSIETDFWFLSQIYLLVYRPAQCRKICQHFCTSRISFVIKTMATMGRTWAVLASVTIAFDHHKCVREPIMFPGLNCQWFSMSAIVQLLTTVSSHWITILWGITTMSPRKCSACEWRWPSKCKRRHSMRRGSSPESTI